jgi:hypothetical protein
MPSSASLRSDIRELEHFRPPIFGSASAAVEALADPRVSRLLSDIGLETPSQDLRTPEGVRAFQKAEVEKWWPIINAAGIKPE